VRDLIGSLLLRHICQLVSNAHAITAVIRLNTASSSSQAAGPAFDSQLSTSGGEVPGSPAVDESQQVRIATAIYPTASLMNHSCDPSIISRSG